MAKLVKQKYTNAKGERKTYSYLAPIPKVVVEKANIGDADEIVAYEEKGKIIIQKKYHFICEDCGFEWDEGNDDDYLTLCPRCMKCENIYIEKNGEL